MTRMTFKYLTMLHDNMVKEMETSEHTEVSLDSERRLFEEASRVSGVMVTGYTHGELTLYQVFREAYEASL